VTIKIDRLSDREQTKYKESILISNMVNSEYGKQFRRTNQLQNNFKHGRRRNSTITLVSLLREFTTFIKNNAHPDFTE